MSLRQETNLRTAKSKHERNQMAPHVFSVTAVAPRPKDIGHGKPVDENKSPTSATTKPTAEDGVHQKQKNTDTPTVGHSDLINCCHIACYWTTHPLDAEAQKKNVRE